MKKSRKQFYFHYCFSLLILFQLSITKYNHIFNHLLVNASDLTSWFNKYTCTTNTFPAKIVGSKDATYATYSIDTALYLGDSSSGYYRPSINQDYGLLYAGEHIAYIKASHINSLYTNEVRYSGSTVTMWLYIMDSQRDQTLACKQNRNSVNDVSEKVCLGMKNGSYYGSIYDEILMFDADVEEGWNFVALIVTMDGTSTYSRLRVVAYSRSRVVASYKTFSYSYQDDVEYDLAFGGKWSNDGLNITNGFAGYILEIRLYSDVELSIEDLDTQVSYDVTSNANGQKLCEFWPAYVTSNSGKCLEDFLTSRNNANYLVAKYALSGSMSGITRNYYSGIVGSNYKFYMGNAPPDIRIPDYEPHRSEINGLYFDGNDYISQALEGTVLTFDKYFTVELWVRFIEEAPSQTYYLFQKIDTFGFDTPFFQFYFGTNRSFIIEMNETVVLEIENAYDSSFPQEWVYIGVSFAKLYYPSTLDEGYYYSKSCVYIWGPNNFEKSGCALINDYYDETWKRPNAWETRMGNGLKGFIRNVYIWNFYKALSTMYYTPRRNYPFKDKCSAFTNQGYPVCSACDQLLASSTCFSSCVTNSYASDYNFCLNQNCTNDLCTSCYADTKSINDNYCTACIDNAELQESYLGSCKCKDGYYLDDDTTTCKQCHDNCLTCYGPGNNQCYKCKTERPLWRGKCLDNCGQIDIPYNSSYIFNSKEQTCLPCFDFYYTLNWKECVAQPYPVKILSHTNQYLIISFSQPVKYNGATPDQFFQISISGSLDSYDFTWSVPYWESNQYQKDVFVEYQITSKLNGDEQISIYLDTVYITDAREYNVLARNSTSKSEFLPLRAPLSAQDYISATERAIIQGSGTGVLLSLLFTFGFNILLSFLSSGSMEIMWVFLNVVQILNYVPDLNLNFPSILILMFNYLAIANSDVSFLARMFAYVFNLNSNTFPNDRYIHDNFNKNGYSSMKIIMNLQSQMAMIVAFTIIFALLVVLKNLLNRCCGKGKFLAQIEKGFLWNGIIRFYLESFLEINTSAYINVSDLDFSDGLNIFCSTLSIFLLCLSLLFPILSCFYLYQYHEKLHEEHVAQQYGAVYEEYKHKKWYQFMHTTFFISRRLIFIIILVFLHNYPYVQVISFQALNFLMILVFILMRPYKENLLNNFAIINEVFLFIVGCYLFLFADDSQKQSTLKFYSWVIIGIVVLMVLINILFIFPYKIYETYLNCKEKARIRRLRMISEVEQKYLFFDYKKFFMKTINQYASKQVEQLPSPKFQKKVKEIRATKVYQPTEEDEHQQTSKSSLNDSGDRISPEAYSNNLFATIQPDIKIQTPRNQFEENYQQPLFQESENSPRSLDRDQIGPNAIILDKNKPNDQLSNNAPGFQWLNDLNNELPPEYNPSDNEGDDYNGPINQQYASNAPLFQDQPYPDNLTEPFNDNNRLTKPQKNVTFEDPNNAFNNTDGFVKKKTKPKGFFESMIENQGESDGIFKSEGEEEKQY